MKRLGLLIAGMILLTAITFVYALKPANKTNEPANITYQSSLTGINNGKQLLETKCNICHGLKDSAAAMLAPPFVNIKSKYMAVYKTEDDFVKGIVDFTMNPTKEKALMRGSLKRFAVMPKMGYPESELKEIAKYIHTNDFKKPSWFVK